MISRHVQWRNDEAGRLQPFLADRPDVRVVWAPQPGSQAAFYECPVTEALFEGGRGNGKTESVLMSYAQHVDQGYGADWRGIIFRRSVPELQDIIAKSQRLFRELFPAAVYNETRKVWRFAGGEVLIFSEMARPSDYYKFHGHGYTFIGWEEITNWPTPECYTSMFSCLRSSNPNVPRLVRANCNPSGVGHNWVKARFGLPVPAGRLVGRVIRSPGQPDRVAIHGHLRENRVLEAAEPNYADSLRTSAAEKGPGVAAAWIDGSWDIVSGGMFDDLWSRDVHVLPGLVPAEVPAGWTINRSFDWGSSAPFSVGWWAESNGEPWTVQGRAVGVVRGDLIRIAEWYGWNGQPNKGCSMAARDIALGVRERERAMDILSRVRPGPADTAIWNADAGDPRASVASAMAGAGVTWEQADKGSGSRVQGWEAIRSMLRGALPPMSGPRERPGLFVSALCGQFLRTIPVLPRCEKNPDDVDSDSEDHIADEMRYRVRTRTPVKQGFVGATARRPSLGAAG